MRDVGRSAATIFGIGYVTASVSPFAIGIARDATGSFTLGLLSLSGLGVAIAIAGMAMPGTPGNRGTKTV